MGYIKDLKPCPWCGEQKGIYYWSRRAHCWTIVCKGTIEKHFDGSKYDAQCGAIGPWAHGTQKGRPGKKVAAELKKLWNSRWQDKWLDENLGQLTHEDIQKLIEDEKKGTLEYMRLRGQAEPMGKLEPQEGMTVFTWEGKPISLGEARDRLNSCKQQWLLAGMAWPKFMRDMEKSLEIEEMRMGIEPNPIIDEVPYKQDASPVLRFTIADETNHDISDGFFDRLRSMMKKIRHLMPFDGASG